jgi:hypothetical protein
MGNIWAESKVSDETPFLDRLYRNQQLSKVSV